MLKTRIHKCCLMLIAAGAALIAGCGEDFPCVGSGGEFFLSLSGFDSAALERVVVIRYTGQRTNVSDSTVYLLSASPNPLQYYDQVNHFVSWPYNVRFWEGSSWEIQITNTGKKHTISGVVISRGTAHRGFNEKAPVCYNNVQSYYVDGKRVETGLPESSNSANYISIEIKP